MRLWTFAQSFSIVSIASPRGLVNLWPGIVFLAKASLALRILPYQVGAPNSARVVRNHFKVHNGGSRLSGTFGRSSEVQHVQYDKANCFYHCSAVH